MIKSKLITTIFQKYLFNKDIRIFKNNFLYYLTFRLIRNFLSKDLIIQIYSFKVFCSLKKNKTSYFLLKKCEFGDYHELRLIKKYSIIGKILFIDCGCNYGFYSFYTASLSSKNLIISVEASEKTSNEFLNNLKLNSFSNIYFLNKAISDKDDESITFNESDNDWESSQSHSQFKIASTTIVKTAKIDSVIKNYEIDDYQIIIKLDVEGNEIKAIEGSINLIIQKSPLFIIELSKYIFDNNKNIEYLKNFLIKYDYSIYNLNKKKMNLSEILSKLNQLEDKYKTIGNYFLIKNSSKSLEHFILNE